MPEDHKKLFIADASVLYKWGAFEPELFIQAMSFRRDWVEGKISIAVPAHCFSEISNTLGIKNADFALSFLSNLILSDIEQYQLNISIAGIAFSLMKKYKKISFYDACYHAMAIHINGTFITADAKYYNTVKRKKYIMQLSDYL